MPLINQTFESLPDLDDPISDSLAAEIKSSLLSSLPLSASTIPHPSLPPANDPTFPPLISASISALSTGAPKPPNSGIDTSRYESLSAPSSTPSPSDPAWASTLHSAATSHAYLAARSQHLELLEQYGKNAWLVSNWHTEAELGALERELERKREEERLVEEERKRAQEEAAGEMEVLESTWKRGVGRALEADLAAEQVRRRVLEERRRGAGGGGE